MSHADRMATLEAADTAIVFADLQPALVHKSRTHSGEAIAAGAEALARAADVLACPMLFSLVGVDGKPAQHLPELAAHARQANSFTRTVARPFDDADFATALTATGRGTLVIAGYSSEAVLQYLALDGIARGYRIVVAIEACGGRSARAEAAALRRIERAGAIVTSVADILQSAEPDMASPRGQSIFGIVHDFMGKDV
ncbi:isochorismatase family protein [Salinisphaera sp. Q1T1-3]|uniref:isochorismatase family protein n=1 Tax=Salinisphaera sp. Q1T1-3 TaxID=2321229 RepID=UPI000E74D582|nr:isochorismatase family protein [Salinisphaera sp. Q1T1-3]RJS94843.1 isochorismatase family protein [Salinisphaera sp. Q1T1-3]